MRHGERADFVQADSENAPPYDNKIDHDPPLTAKGIKQASHAGLYIKDHLQAIEKEYGIKFDEVQIQSSPFLRCLQTSSRIAQALSIKSIKVDYLMSEDAGCAESEDNGNPLD